VQTCLTSSNDCGDNRYDPLQDLLEICQSALLNAAIASGSATATPQSSDVAQPSSAVVETDAPSPTTLASDSSPLQTDDAGSAPTDDTHHTSLSVVAISGIVFGSVVFIVGLAFAIFCLLRKRRKRSADSVIFSPAKKFTGDNKRQKRQSAWFSGDTEGKGEHIIESEPYFGFDKEMGLMISTDVIVPIPGEKPRVSVITSSNAYDYTLPPSEPVPSISPQRTSPPRISLTYAAQPQRPSLTTSNTQLVLPHATVSEISDSTPSSKRNSEQSIHNFTQNNLHPGIAIPSMNFIPPTPQTNRSPISPVDQQREDIFGYYTTTRPEHLHNEIGTAVSTPTSSVPVYQAYAPTTQSQEEESESPKVETPIYGHQKSHSVAYRFTVPKPYEIPNRRSQPTTSSAPTVQKPRPRTADNSKPPTTGLIILKKPPRASSPFPTTPRSLTHRTTLSTASSVTLISADNVDLSAFPSTINRAASQSWRASVERAADRAMDRVRQTDVVQEDEEHLTSEGEAARGRNRWRKSLQSVQDLWENHAARNEDGSQSKRSSTRLSDNVV